MFDWHAFFDRLRAGRCAEFDCGGGTAGLTFSSPVAGQTYPNTGVPLSYDLPAGYIHAFFMINPLNEFVATLTLDGRGGQEIPWSFVGGVSSAWGWDKLAGPIGATLQQNSGGVQNLNVIAVAYKIADGTLLVGSLGAFNLESL